MLGAVWDWLTPDQADVERWAVWVAAISAGVAGVLYLLGKARTVVRRAWSWWAETRARFDRLDALLTHELQPNSGSSLKDAVVANAAGVNRLEQRVDDLELHLGVMAEAQTNLWPALEAIANSTPAKAPKDAKHHQHKRSTDDVGNA